MRPLAFDRRGSAPFVALLATSLVVTLGWTFRGLLPRAETPTAALDGQAEAEREALAATGATLALHRLWVPFELSRRHASATTQRDLRAYLDDFGLVAGADWSDVTERLELGRLRSPSAVDSRRAQLVSVAAKRRDEPRATQLLFRLTTEGGDTASQRATFEVEYEVGPRRWPGLDFALLATRLAGPLCDATIEHALPAALEPVRVGALTASACRSDAELAPERFPPAFPGVEATTTGTITGGHRHVVEAGRTIDSPAELDELRGTSNVGALRGFVRGSVHLAGSAPDPVVIDGSVTIDGDLVIAGYVRGAGSIRVSGNVYLPASMIYADGRDAEGERTFGVAADGTPNVLALAAGGNVVVGDFLGGPAGAGALVATSLARFNRDEWTRTQPVLPAVDDDLADPAAWTVVNPLYEGAEHAPRYFALDERSPVAILRDGYFDADTLEWVARGLSPWGPRVWHADPNDPADRFVGRREHPRAPHVLHITASRDWIDAEHLGRLLAAAANVDVDSSLVIDSTLYSANAIVGEVAANDVTIEGALVAAHVALHAPGGLRIRHDARGKRWLHLDSTTELDVRRVGAEAVVGP